MTIEAWILSLIPTILLFILACLARSQFRSWLAPGAFFTLYWTGGLLIPLTITADFYFWPGAAWFILLFAAILYIGSVIGWTIGHHLRRSSYYREKAHTYHLFLGKPILILFTMLGGLSIPLILQDQGYSIMALFHLELLAQVAREFSVLRYMEFYEPPFSARFLTTFTYAGALFGGLWFALDTPRHNRLWGLLPFGPALLQTLILTTRSSFLFPFELFTAVYLSMLVLLHKHPRLVSWKFIRRAVLIACIGSVVFLSAQVLRDRLTWDDIGIALTKFRASTFGSPAAFSRWLEYGWQHDQPAWGAFTFAGLFDWLGIRQRVQGLYSEVVYLSAAQIQTESSNIYTAFRSLIEDFTLPGAMIIVAITGCVASFAYRRVFAGESAWLPILVLFYAFVLHSFITSFLTYNSLLLAWVLFSLSIGPVGPRLLRMIPCTETKLLTEATCSQDKQMKRANSPRASVGPRRSDLP